MKLNKVSVLVFLVSVVACVSAYGNSVGEENLLQGYSPEIQDVIRGSSLEKDFPDPNERADELKVYLGEIDKIDKSVKKRRFGDEINHGKKSDSEWLEESANILSASIRRYPESRHLHEALAYVYRELGAFTNRSEYLLKATEEFSRAEELGIKYGKGMYAHYSVVMSQIASQEKQKNILDKYFSRVFKEFPDDDMSLLWYAQALAAMQDTRAEEAFEKALAAAEGNNIDQVISYSEYLLDQIKYEKALQVLNALPASVVSYYAHFLKGFAFESLDRPIEAEQEYAEYNNFQGIVQQYPGVSAFGQMFFRPPAKYNRNSKIQKEKRIRFKEAEAATTSSLAASYGPGIYPPESRSTSGLCATTDYACKTYYYAVWIVDGEAMRNSGTVGMGRAVFWNVRARAFNYIGKRVCNGVTAVCFNCPNMNDFPPPANDNELLIRYFEVMNKCGYAGLTVGNLTSAAEQIVLDVFYGTVPDPTNGLCVPGVWTSNACNAYCATSSYWGAFDSTVSCMEFRAGQLKKYITTSSECYKFVPMLTPGGSACGYGCWGSQKLICPRTVNNNSGYRCWDSMYGGFYNYTGPVYGNFCWSFVR